VITSLGLAWSPVAAAPAQSNGDQLFAFATFKAAEAPLSTTWSNMLRALNDERPIITHCRTEPSTCFSPAALKFLALVKEGEYLEGRSQIAHINRAANAAFRSETSAHKDEEWRTPLNAIAKGIGNCKHYAVLKYALLAAAGVALDALRIVVVEVRASHELHAMVAVRSEGRWLLLDNRSAILIESTLAVDYYKPLYVLDQDGVAQFAPTDRLQMVAQSDKSTY
jgi:predicted transglutaminase-like cysteine proteinase